VQRWARLIKAGKKIEYLELFAPVSVVAGGGVSNAGRSRLPTRLMVPCWISSMPSTRGTMT
jgi:hypothetical protein